MSKLTPYQKRRNFSKTPEPKGKIEKTTKSPIFVVQKHWATHLHYDLRLEIQGTLKSWAIPKEPSKAPLVKRLAILTENHPLAYANFSGVIPKNEYGAGKVAIWDKGHFENIHKDEKGKEISLPKSFKNGLIVVSLQGKKLKGKYVLVHLKDKNWLFFTKA